MSSQEDIKKPSKQEPHQWQDLQAYYPPRHPKSNPFNDVIVPADVQMVNISTIKSHMAPEMNKLIYEGNEFHCYSFMATVILLVGIITGFVLFSAIKLPMGVLIAFIIISYALYLILALCCNPFGDYLGKVERGQHFQRCYQYIKNSTGQFQVHAQCYHYKGESKRRRDQTSCVCPCCHKKVVSHTASQTLIPKTLIDMSGRIESLKSEKRIVFIHFTVNPLFADEVSRTNFHKNYTLFKQKNTKDHYQDFTYNFKIQGLDEIKTFEMGQRNCQLKCWYYIFGVLGLMWPFSLWVECNSDRFKVVYIKAMTF